MKTLTNIMELVMSNLDYRRCYQDYHQVSANSSRKSDDIMILRPYKDYLKSKKKAEKGAQLSSTSTIDKMNKLEAQSGSLNYHSRVYLPENMLSFGEIMEIRTIFIYDKFLQFEPQEKFVVFNSFTFCLVFLEKWVSKATSGRCDLTDYQELKFKKNMDLNIEISKMDMFVATNGVHIVTEIFELYLQHVELVINQVASS